MYRANSLWCSKECHGGKNKVECYDDDDDEDDDSFHYSQVFKLASAQPEVPLESAVVQLQLLQEALKLTELVPPSYASMRPEPTSASSLLQNSPWYVQRSNRASWKIGTIGDNEITVRLKMWARTASHHFLCQHNSFICGVWCERSLRLTMKN